MKQKEEHTYKGSTTVEMAYIMPTVMLVFLVVVYTTFYYHDKNILYGAASETAVLGAQKQRAQEGIEEGEIEMFCKERIRGKLILLSGLQVSVSEDAKGISVTASASKGRLKITARQRVFTVEPEAFIRLIERGKGN